MTRCAFFATWRKESGSCAARLFMVEIEAGMVGICHVPSAEGSRVVLICVPQYELRWCCCGKIMVASRAQHTARRRDDQSMFQRRSTSAMNLMCRMYGSMSWWYRELSRLETSWRSDFSLGPESALCQQRRLDCGRYIGTPLVAAAADTKSWRFLVVETDLIRVAVRLVGSSSTPSAM